MKKFHVFKKRFPPDYEIPPSPPQVRRKPQTLKQRIKSVVDSSRPTEEKLRKLAKIKSEITALGQELSAETLSLFSKAEDDINGVIPATPSQESGNKKNTASPASSPIASDPSIIAPESQLKTQKYVSSPSPPIQSQAFVHPADEFEKEADEILAVFDSSKTIEMPNSKTQASKTQGYDTESQDPLMKQICAKKGAARALGLMSNTIRALREKYRAAPKSNVAKVKVVGKILGLPDLNN